MRSEKELQDAITGLADELGLWWHHETDSRKSGRGWVDLVILGPAGALFAEVKGSGGRRSANQHLIGRLLGRAGLEYRVWYPVDWHSGDIKRDLKEIADVR